MCKVKNIVMLALAATMLTSQVTFAAPAKQDDPYTYVAPRLATADALNGARRFAERIATDDLGERIRGRLALKEENGEGQAVDSLVDSVFGSLVGQIESRLKGLRDASGLGEPLSQTRAEKEETESKLEAAQKALEAQQKIQGELPADATGVQRRAVAKAVQQVQDQVQLLTRDVRALTTGCEGLEEDLRNAQEQTKTAQDNLVRLTLAAPQALYDMLNPEDEETHGSAVAASVAALARVSGYAGMNFQAVLRYAQDLKNQLHSLYVGRVYDRMEDTALVAEVRSVVSDGLDLPANTARVAAQRLKDAAATKAIEGKTLEQLRAYLKRAMYASVTKASSEPIAAVLQSNKTEGEFVRAILAAASEDKAEEALPQKVNAVSISQVDAERFAEGRLDAVVALFEGTLGDLPQKAADLFKTRLGIKTELETVPGDFDDVASVAVSAPAAASVPAPAARPAGRDPMPMFGRR